MQQKKKGFRVWGSGFRDWGVGWWGLKKRGLRSARGT